MSTRPAYHSRSHGHIGAFGAWRRLPTTANGRPATALYLRRDGEQSYDAWSIRVLTLRGSRIAEITPFIDATIFPRFGLPDSLP